VVNSAAEDSPKEDTRLHWLTPMAHAKSLARAAIESQVTPLNSPLLDHSNTGDCLFIFLSRCLTDP
jgi:hypothetical protein